MDPTDGYLKSWKPVPLRPYLIRRMRRGLTRSRRRRLVAIRYLLYFGVVRLTKFLLGVPAGCNFTPKIGVKWYNLTAALEGACS